MKDNKIQKRTKTPVHFKTYEIDALRPQTRAECHGKTKRLKGLLPESINGSKSEAFPLIGSSYTKSTR